MFLAWAILNDLHGDFHREESAEAIEAVRRREQTGRDFLFKECDEKFWTEDLSELGNAFASFYYSDESGTNGPYLDDYGQTLGGDVPTLYHVADTWENYDKLAPVITRRFEEWTRART